MCVDLQIQSGQKWKLKGLHWRQNVQSQMVIIDSIVVVSLRQIPIHIFISCTNCPSIFMFQLILQLKVQKGSETHQILVFLSRTNRDFIERPRLIILPCGAMYYNHIPRTSHVLLSVLGTCINYKASTTVSTITLFLLG